MSTLCAIVAIFILLYSLRGALYDGLNAMDLIPKDEHFTELYFENHTSLPHAIFQGETISFAFTIHNLEGATTTYPYSVYFYDGTSTIPIDQSTTTIPDNGTSTESETYTFKTSPMWQEIFIELIGRDQFIHFKMGNDPS